VACSGTTKLASIQVIPNVANFTAPGQTAQFRAIGNFAHSNQSKSTRDITSEVTWQSSNIAVATISPTGLATAVAAGTTTIVATDTVSDNVVTGSANVDATSITGGPGGTAHDLVAMSIIPAAGAQVVNSVGETSQFIAVGTFNSAPVTQDVTAQVSWQSSDVKIATINTSGLATALNCDLPPPTPCITNITATATTTGGTFITATSNLSVDGATTPVQLPTLTVYKVGVGAETGAVVTVISPTNLTPDGIVNCGPGATSGAACTAHFAIGKSVTLLATPDVASGSSFGGWSANCIPNTATTCTVTMNNNETVGAIFN